MGDYKNGNAKLLTPEAPRRPEAPSPRSSIRSKSPIQSSELPQKRAIAPKRATILESDQSLMGLTSPSKDAPKRAGPRATTLLLANASVLEDESDSDSDHEAF